VNSGSRQSVHDTFCLTVRYVTQRRFVMSHRLFGTSYRGEGGGSSGPRRTAWPL